MSECARMKGYVLTLRYMLQVHEKQFNSQESLPTSENPISTSTALGYLVDGSLQTLRPCIIMKRYEINQ